jgi:serine/threonine protein kinase
MVGHQFVGRADEIQEFVSRLQHSAGGSFLITGYRGVGKTSFVNQVLSVLCERTPLLDIYVNLARPLTEAELMHLIVRRLYERLVEKDWYQSLGPELQRRMTLAYQRTSANVVRKVSDTWERGIEISVPNAAPLKLPFSPKWTGKRARNIDFETSFLAYDDKAAEQDVISIARTLAQGISEKRRGWLGTWQRFRRVRPALVVMKIVFVFDELDKLDDKAGPNQHSEVEKMLTGLKNLFTTSGICFLFVAGKDLHERWLRDIWRGDSVFESVFSYDKYLPCMWSDVDALADKLAVFDAKSGGSQSELVFNGFKNYLRFKGRGIPRRILRAFNELVSWQNNYPVLNFRNEQLRRINFYSQLNKTLESNVENLFGRSTEEIAGTRQDRLRLGVYYVIDWILRQGVAEFTASDLLNASRELSSRISLAEEIAIGTIGELLDVLVDGEYIETVDQKLDQVAIDVGNTAGEKRYRLTERRLAELGGIEANIEEDGKFEPPGPSSEAHARRIGNYELQEVLGQGGMGSVYRAWDTAKRRFVALKLLHRWLSTNPDAQERFRRELATLERLKHRNIVSFLESGEWESQFFLAMEFVDGIDLDRVLGSVGALDIETAAAILLPVGNAIEYAHSQGFLRLDVKPSNVRISTEGRVYLMDVGIAREGEDSKSITQQGSFVGTPFYLAPEQARDGPVDRRVDIYSFGVVLYEALTGRRPFSGEDAFAIVTKHMQEMPPLPSQFASIPKTLEDVILRCLEKSPDARYQSMTEVLLALDACARERKSEQELAAFTKHVKRDAKRTDAERRDPTLILESEGMPGLGTSAFATVSGPMPPPLAAGPLASATHGERSDPSPPPDSPTADAVRPPTVESSFAPSPRQVAGPVDAGEHVPLRNAHLTSWIEFMRDGSQPEHYQLSKEITSIGRAQTNDVRLSGETGVSRFHTRIVWDHDGFIMVDLNSSNGTYLNGVRVLEPVPLKNGDQIEIGNAHFVFHAS